LTFDPDELTVESCLRYLDMLQEGGGANYASVLLDLALTKVASFRDVFVLLKRFEEMQIAEKYIEHMVSHINASCSGVDLDSYRAFREYFAENYDVRWLMKGFIRSFGLRLSHVALINILGVKEAVEFLKKGTWLSQSFNKRHKIMKRVYFKKRGYFWHSYHGNRLEIPDDLGLYVVIFHSYPWPLDNYYTECDMSVLHLEGFPIEHAAKCVALVDCDFEFANRLVQAVRGVERSCGRVVGDRKIINACFPGNAFRLQFIVDEARKSYGRALVAS